MTGLDVAYVAEVVLHLLRECGREIVLEDRAHRETVVVPVDAAACADGLLPVFLTAGEAIALDAFGERFGVKLERDLGAFFSWRVEAIGAETLSEVMLPTMEALAQATVGGAIKVVELSRVIDEAESRYKARRALP